ncbi:8-oxo-dGTP pyrophosphatase MutT, NUDIX family [Roseovarius azorensis]|uniref:8-oxo-dGTP pyrophosphatase MutT, NUDIX family n=1 Tax=Roseovarius azorensis TaxID=1287727 RepID=A0A1H7MI37_9RHOB|nr:NUDIX hydrolase [Roseovarius azorensis]SEL10277.1 8-oxo-dGTP pyrophosphatase MutT, NUDIX family [Roseovarius azorensis]
MTGTEHDKSALRDAATVIVLRDAESRPHVLMGQRGATAAFMPNKFVFPGGAVDPGDAEVPLARPLPALCAERLREDSARDLSRALAVAAIRELWEETGLPLGHPGAWPGDIPPDWTGFATRGLLPVADPLQFVFRAITPPGRPRRFDARFFLVHAEAITGDLDDFSAACEELSHLQWVPLADARRFDLPFITEVVLAEVAARAHDRTPPASVPFFRNDDEKSLFLRLNGAPPQRSPTA